MPGAVRAITRIQDADDFTGSLTDTYIPVWSNSQQKFVMTAQATTSPGGSTGYIQYNNGGAFGASGVYWDAVNSRVGIGTASPISRFQVVDSGSTGQITLGDSANANYLRLQSQAVLGQSFIDSNGVLILKAASAEVMRLQSGNVGIGTTSPGQKLDVNGSVNVATALIVPDIRPASNAVNSTGFSNASGTRVLSVDTTNSRVGIGTTAPNAKLDISSSTSIANFSAQNTTSTSSAISGYANYAATINQIIQPSSTGVAADFGGLSVTASYNNANINTGRYTYGLNSVAYNNASGTVSDIFGCNSAVGNYHASGMVTNAIANRSAINDYAGIITNAFGYKFTGRVFGSGTIQNSYGIYVDSVNYATISNYSIYTNAGDIRLMSSNSDKIGFHGVTPVARQLLATGAGRTVDDVITFLQNLGLARQS